MARLKATFDDHFEHGWAILTLTSSNQTAAVNISHIYNSMYQLTLVLQRLRHETGVFAVTCMAEPMEYEMSFEKEKDIIQFNVAEFQGHRRGSIKGRPIIAVSGNYEEVGMPLWRALRSLQGQFTEDELQVRWRGFPTQELNALSTEINQQAKTPK